MPAVTTWEETKVSLSIDTVWYLYTAAICWSMEHPDTDDSLRNALHEANDVMRAASWEGRSPKDLLPWLRTRKSSSDAKQRIKEK